MLADKLRAAAAAAEAFPVFVSSSITSVNTAANTVTAPSGIQNGDLLVAVCVHRNTQMQITPPTGFSVLSGENATDNSLFIATKVAASESGNYTFTWTGAGANSANVATILVYRNATRVNTVGAKASSAGAASITATSITPSFRGVLVGAFSKPNTAETVSSAPSGMTQRALSTTTSTLAVYDQSPQEATATGTKSATFSAAGQAAAVLLQITNEPTVAPEFVASASAQNTTSSNTLTINKPTGTQEGDLMVAVMAAGGGSVSNWNDTTFTEIADQGLTAPGVRIAYKVAGASEPSSYSFTNFTPSRTLAGCILAYRFAAYDTIGSFVAGANPLVLTSISPSDSQSVLIAAGVRDGASITLGTPTSMTARVTDADGTSPSYIVCDQIVAKGPTGTRSMSTGSTSSVAGIMLSIKPTRSL